MSETRTMAVPIANVRPASVNGAGVPDLNAGAERLGDGRGRGAAPGQQIADSRLRQRAVVAPAPSRASTGVRADRLVFDVIGSTTDDLDVEDERQAPRGDVVDLVAEPHPAAPILFLDERFVLRRMGIEQVPQQASGRLRVRDQVGAGWNRTRARP